MRNSGLRSNRNWRALWLGQAVSVIGDNVFDVTVVLWISSVLARGQSWAPAAVGMVLITAVVPMVLVGPLAGVYVDRWDHRRTMLGADLVRFGLTLSLLLVPALGSLLPTAAALAFVYAVVALNSVAAQFFNPARFALIATTVPPEDRPQAASLTQATASFAAIVGPPLAAPLLFSVGVQLALVVNALSFAGSFLALRTTRVAAAGAPGEAGAEPQQPATAPAGASPRNLSRDFSAGLRAFAGNRALVTICAAVSVAMIGVGAINALDVFFVSDNLHQDASRLGLLGCAFGIGSLAGALAAGPIARRVGSRHVFWAALVTAGLLMLAYSRSTTLPVALALLFLAGLPVSALNAVVGPIIMDATPKELLGRIIAVMNPVTRVASVLSMALAGLLASTLMLHFHTTVLGVRLGRIDTIFGTGAVLMLLAGLMALWALRPAMPQTPAPLPPSSPTEPAAADPASGPGGQNRTPGSDQDPYSLRKGDAQ